MINKLNALFAHFNNEALKLDDTAVKLANKATKLDDKAIKAAPKKSPDRLKIEALELEILELKNELQKYKPKEIKVIRN